MLKLLVGTSLTALVMAGAARAETAPPAAGADPTAIQEVVITAQKRQENLQEVPIAVTALTAEALKNKKVDNLMGLSGLAPALQIKTDDNAANPRIFIRGVGVNDFNPSTASAVGIYVDGVYIASPLAQLAAFYDLQQVEVLRGPQGTLYGRNTTGGAINVTTKKPTDHYEGDLAFEYGRFNEVNIQGGVGGPLLGDKVLLRLSGVYVRDDGYTLDRTTGKHGNNQDRYGVRAALRLKPTSQITDDLTISTNQSRGGSILAYNRSLVAEPSSAAAPDKPDPALGYFLCKPGYYTSGLCTNVLGYANTSKDLYAGDYSFLGKDIVKLFGVSNTLNYDFGPATLVSVTSYQRAARNDQEETDASPYPLITASYVALQKTVSQEFRLQSNGHTRLRYVGGIYYAHDDLSNNSYYDILRAARTPTPENPTGVDLANNIGVYGWPLTQATDSYAIFGQVDYDLTDRLTVTGGLRYSADRKVFHYESEAEFGTIPIFPTPFDAAKTFGSVSGRVGLQYKLSADANLYFTYNRGTKSGGFFSGQTTEEADLGPYKDENVNAYEVGAKTEFLDHRLRANFSAFYYDYKDLQVYTAVQRNKVTVQLFTNASAARMYGAEVELQARPMRGLDLSLSGALLSATYQDFKSVADDYSGNTLPSAPKASLNGTAHYEHDVPIGVFVGQIDFTYRSKVYFDTANTERLSDPARIYVNGQVGLKLKDGRYEVGVWGRNLFNVTNIVDITPIAGLGFDVFSVGQPRTYGLYLRAKY